MDNYQARNAIQAERTIKAALAVLNLPTRGSYNPGEVSSILGITERTFWRLTKQYELNQTGKMVRPDCLKSFILGAHRRVSFLELVEFIRRNDEYLRNNLRSAEVKGK